MVNNVGVFICRFFLLGVEWVAICLICFFPFLLQIFLGFSVLVFLEGGRCLGGN